VDGAGVSVNEPGPDTPSSRAVPDTSAPDDWATRRADEVLARAEAFALDAAPTPQVRALLDTAFIGLREQARRFQQVHFVHLPLLVYGNLRGDDVPATPLAAATSLFFLGLDICDDLADDDLPEHWSGWSTNEINLVSLALLATLPQLAIEGLDAPAATRAAMQAALARGLLCMMGGQQRDLSAAGTAEVSAAAVEETIAAKGGEELAIFATLAAQLAGAAPDQIERYAALGRVLGTGGQLVSDCLDVFNAPHSKDLAAGARTLPIVLGLNQLEGRARADFLALLDRARHDEAACEDVRRQLRDPGVVWRCALTIEVYRQRALRLLDTVGGQEPANGRLRTMIQGLTWPG